MRIYTSLSVWKLVDYLCMVCMAVYMRIYTYLSMWEFGGNFVGIYTYLTV